MVMSLRKEIEKRVKAMEKDLVEMKKMLKENPRKKEIAELKRRRRRVTIGPVASVHGRGCGHTGMGHC